VSSELIETNRLRQLRHDRTRNSNRVRRQIHALLTNPAKWDLQGRLVEPGYVGLPSWWPFWYDCLLRDVRDLVRTARRLADAEGIALGESE